MMANFVSFGGCFVLREENVKGDVLGAGLAYNQALSH